MLNIAIIGCGGISAPHIQAYRLFPQLCKVVALVDIYKEKAQKRAAEFDLQVEVFDSYEVLLGRPDIDLVSICTPPFTHAELTVAFLKAGKHVLVEKPMAASLEECDAMLAAERESGRVLSVVAQNRFRNPIMRIKKVLESGLAGRILHAQVDSFWWRGQAYYDLWWRGTWEKEGGGCTLNHAVHHIDMLNWMMGAPVEISAVLNNAGHDNAEVEDLSVAVLRYANGALATLTSSVLHHGEEQQIVFQGSAARVSTPWKVFASISKNNGFPDARDTDLETRLSDLYESVPELAHEGHTAQIFDVISALDAGTSPMVRGQDGRRTLEVISAIYKAGSTKTTVSFPLDANDAFYTRQGILANTPRFHKKKASIENFEDSSITL